MAGRSRKHEQVMGVRGQSAGVSPAAQGVRFPGRRRETCWEGLASGKAAELYWEMDSEPLGASGTARPPRGQPCPGVAAPQAHPSSSPA